jgi:hypothetical protein
MLARYIARPLRLLNVSRASFGSGHGHDHHDHHHYEVTLDKQATWVKYKSVVNDLLRTLS